MEVTELLSAEGGRERAGLDTVYADGVLVDPGGGHRIEVRGCDLWEFREAAISRKDSYWKIIEG